LANYDASFTVSSIALKVDFTAPVGDYAYTTNWALQVADAIMDPAWGLGDPSVNMDQLVAASNVCDEMVACAAGEEARYSLSWHYDTGISPGNVIEQMMLDAAGRLSRIGGEWFIWPAYWQGLDYTLVAGETPVPSFSFDENALTGAISWTPKRSMNELFNRVTGIYIAPNFPYNVAGNLYDSPHGYDFEGVTQNNFQYAFQPSTYPMYACDQLHGFGVGVDVFLTEDYGIYLPKDISQPCCLSISQAQRCAKILLLRNRQQGTGTFPMNLSAWQMQPADTMLFTMPALGWTNKLLEVVGVRFKQRTADNDSIGYYVEVDVQETDPSVYEWSEQEELTPYDVPSITYTGTTTSVVNSVTLPSAEFTVAGTSNLVITLNSQDAGMVLAAPATADGTPAFRAIEPSDLPVATSTTMGIVQPDNTTITISDGILSAVAGGSTHSESLTDGNANFIFASTLTEGGDVITIAGVPD
jgi:hypothetical protein